MPVPDPREVGDRERALDEQPDLLDVLRSHVRPQRPPDRMRAGLWNGDEDELVRGGNDHRPVNFASRFSRKAATPSR